MNPVIKEVNIAFMYLLTNYMRNISNIYILYVLTSITIYSLFCVNKLKGRFN